MKDTIGVTNIFLEPYIIIDKHNCMHLDSEKKYYFGLTKENSFFLPTVDKLIERNNASYFVDQNFQQDVYEDDGITIKGSIYGITLKPTIQVSISAMTKYDCEIIADYVCGFMQHYGLNKFADVPQDIFSI